jgi:hypothetical protein
MELLQLLNHTLTLHTLKPMCVKEKQVCQGILLSPARPCPMFLGPFADAGIDLNISKTSFLPKDISQEGVF